MKIYSAKEKDPAGDRVILVREANDCRPFLEGEKQKAYVVKALDGKSKKAHLNHMDHQQFFIKLEKKEDTDARLLEKARKAGFDIHSRICELEITCLNILNGGVSHEEYLAFAEGLALSNYQFLKYFSPEKMEKNSLEDLALVSIDLNESELERLDELVRAVYHTRDLVNEPLSFLTAEQLAKEVSDLGADAGFEVEVFNKKKIESLKMGGLLAVNKGSIDPPTFSILTWKPEDAVNDKPIVLVGKGVVYDTGGLSLKPTLESMDYMKCDMGGAAAVAGSFYALAKTRLPLWVIGLIPATDNRPDGNAYVPGDVITMYDGSSVEVLNTDAEGRMLLADALSYARQYDPELVIDLATLTGSAHMAIDKYGIVGMGNADRETMNNLNQSGEWCGERIAEFPFWDEYKEQLKSDIADLKNIGGRYGGAITAGKFLEHFTDYPYIHLDIAGPSYNKIPYSYHGKGGSGVGVRIMHEFLKRRAFQK